VFTQKPSIQPAESKSAAAVPKVKQEKPLPKSHFSGGPTANWLWAQQPVASCLFNKRFEGGAKAAHLIATCDNVMTVFVNGKRVATSSEWTSPVKADVTKHLVAGQNQILVEALNQDGPAGFALKLVLTMPDGSKQYIVTDKTWRVATNKEATNWSAPVELAAMGAAPWGNVFTNAAVSLVSAQANRDSFNVLPGFQVELLYTVPKGQQGSWVSCTFDHEGRLIASDQGGKGLYRVTPAPIGIEGETKVEKLNVAMTSCHGLLYAFGKLYCSVNGGPGSGLYALEDTNNDDQYDKVTKLKALQGGGEHGPHAVRLSPDGKSLYVIAGNHTNPPQDFNHSLVPKNWSEDLLLPRQWDARGHARGKLAPGGWIAKTDPEGKMWEVISIGYRNPYDMDFNADGELFAYDADMEWDMGTPWYRPTRVNHAVSGSEFGWRSGTGKWPTHYADSLPAVVDIGPGSPVGAQFGYGTKFPAKYQKALYILDWTFGTMYAIHITPDGASYTGVKEEFVSKTPLPLTDAAVGPEGALYFTVGGRGTQSALYRVTYVGDASTVPVDAKDKQFADLRALRRQLEALHRPGPRDGKAQELIFSNLNHADRFIRYAARVALEHMDAKLWQDRVFTLQDRQSVISAAIALARQGDKALQPKLLAALDAIDIAKLSETQQLELLRAYALTFIRMGQPDAVTGGKLAKRLDPLYPSKSDAMNRELSRLLVYVNSPTVVDKTLELLEREYKPDPLATAALLARNPGYGRSIAAMIANQPEIEKIHHALVLRNQRYGWTLEQRKRYFAYLNEAGKKSGGASYGGFINNIRKEAMARTSEAERKALAANTPPPKPTELPKPKGPGKHWTLSELSAVTQNGLSGRSFENGRIAFSSSRCIVCHRFDGNGGATGPDLTNVAGRFSYRDLAESLVDPNKVISDQYRGSTIETKDGKVISGRITNDADGKLTVVTDPEDATKVVEIAKGDVDAVEPSKVSLMPDKLLDVLSEQEVLDLLAYMMSRGNPDDPMFAK
jgi:putative heme-binding domain-containing protein